MAAPGPKVGDFYLDQYGKIEIKAVLENYVVVRRKGCIPFCMALAEWRRKTTPEDSLDADGKAN